MKLVSTNNQCQPASFREAAVQGLAPDGGLYLPAALPRVSRAWLAATRTRRFPDLAGDLACLLLGDEIAEPALRALVADALDFPVPLIPLAPGRYVLELTHGPTLAFKDVGARFLARVVAQLVAEEGKRLTVLVATSGDTGSAVAQGFYGLAGTRVVLLYPSGKVSHVQEQQLTTLGGNVTALEVRGTFDDCQQLVKQAFADMQLRARVALTSANSINIARLLAQVFYYFGAWAQLKPHNAPVVIAVPSGNFGNLTAGLMAKRMGLPVARFVAATNANAIVPQYLATGQFQPHPSVQTIANAMDVGNPSNFARMLALYEYDVERMRQDIVGYSFSDAQTCWAIQNLYTRYGYTADPHTAIAYLGLNAYLDMAPRAVEGIFLATAHPAKFHEAVAALIDAPVEVPPQLRACLEQPKSARLLPVEYAALRDVLSEGA